MPVLFIGASAAQGSHASQERVSKQAFDGVGRPAQ
jgi:hypothetical protein